MKNKKTTFMLITMAILLILAFSTQTLAKTYKLGFSGAITGTTSDVGVPYSKAIEDYMRYVNDEKLLGKDKVLCFIRDDNYKTENTKSNFEE